MAAQEPDEKEESKGKGKGRGKAKAKAPPAKAKKGAKRSRAAANGVDEDEKEVEVKGKGEAWRHKLLQAVLLAFDKAANPFLSRSADCETSPMELALRQGDLKVRTWLCLLLVFDDGVQAVKLMVEFEDSKQAKDRTRVAMPANTYDTRVFTTGR